MNVFHKLSLAATLCLLGPATAGADVRMPQGLVANGGGAMNDGSLAVQGTLGQMTGGVMGAPGYRCGSGLWLLPQIFCSAVEPAEAGAHLGFQLARVTPNPFRQAAAIDYALGSRCRVRLGLFDVSGRMVRQLVDRQQEPGRFSVTLEGIDLPSGIYFLRMKAGDFTRTLRLVRVR